MKKIIRGIFLGLLAVIVIGGSIGAYMLFGRKGPEIQKKPTVIDAQGNTYLAVVDKNSGETMVAVTDEKGSVYAAVTDSNGNVGATVGNIDNEVNKNDIPTNFTGDKFSITNTNNYAGEVVTEPPTSATVPSTTGSGNNNTTGDRQNTTTSATDTTQSNELKAYRIKKYHDNVFSGGTYLMEFTTNDASMKETMGDLPITMATKNNNIYVQTQIQSMQCEVLMLAPTGSDKDANPTIYLIFDRFKIYCKMPADALGEGETLNMGGAMKNFGGDVDNNDITVSKVSIDGKELICESYVSKKDGETVKYFFDGETLVRRDDISKDGTVNSIFISKLTNEVSDSLFEIPKNYRYLNMSVLEKLAGSGK